MNRSLWLSPHTESASVGIIATNGQHMHTPRDSTRERIATYISTLLYT